MSNVETLLRKSGSSAAVIGTLVLGLQNSAWAADSDVRLSSVGFQEGRTKAVTVRGAVDAYTVHDAESDEVVLSGPVYAGGGTGADRLSVVDISDLPEGRYYVAFGDHGRSIPFPVGPNVYDDALLLSMVGFYGWRSGVDIEFEHQGVTFAHAAGHLEPGLLDYVGAEGETKDGTGGWYDAGDYGKYVVNGAFAAGQMLAAWEQFEDTLDNLTLPIPETDGDLPDFLAEVRVELEWLLKMQILEGDDLGAVYDKLTPRNFAGFVLPEDDSLPNYFVPHSSTATASFTAVMAQGARVFASHDAAFADEMEAAALLAWEWLEANPDHLPPDVEDFSTGNYDSDDADERLWACAELYETTGNEAFLSAFETRLGDRASLVDISWDWPSVGNMGVFTYVLSSRPERDPEVLAELEEAVVNAANSLRSRATSDFYGRAEGYYWGSNGSTARNCMTLQVAYRLEESERFLDTCAEQLGYLFGRNHYNRSQVTGFGIDPPQYPHHRQSGSDDQVRPYPGLLVGGADQEGNWSDQQNSYNTNEVAINWNAALVYALAGLASGDPLVYDGKEGGTAGAVDGPPPPPPPPILDLIDDLEDGDLNIEENDGRNGAWYTSSDNTGTSVDLNVTGDSPGRGEHSIQAQGSGYTNWGAGLGLTFVTSDGALQTYDASAYTGFVFYLKANAGTGEKLRILVRDAQTDPLGGACADCYDHFMQTVELSGDWQQVHVRFDDLRQQGFGDPVPFLRTDQLFGLEFQTPQEVELDIQLDEIGFVNENDETPIAAGGAGPDEEDPLAAPGGGGCSCRQGRSERGSLVVLVGLLMGLGVIGRRRRGRATA